MAQCASADRGPGNGARSGPFVRATRNAGNTWHCTGGEAMAHGNLVDRPSGGGPTRRGGLGLLSLALVVGRWPLVLRQRKGSMMKPSSKDEVAGKIHEVKGAVKEKVGKLANNPDMEADGKVEKVAGRVQKKIGQVKKVLGQ